MRPLVWSVLSFALISFCAPAFGTDPDPDETPGYLCSKNDPDFDDLYYVEKIARCVRNVSKEEKTEIAAEYGVPQSQWKNYEFDHLIPLCAGGSNDARNIWPQPLDEAHEKDKVEDEVCKKMRAGEMKQAEAIHEIFAWFDGKKSHPLQTH
jgi:hypothetical protein